MTDRLLYYLSPVLKFLLYVVCLMLWILPFLLIVQFDFIKIEIDSLTGQLFSQSVLVLIILGALLMVFKVLKDVNFKSVFLVNKSAFPSFLKGSFFGFLLILSCVGMAYLNGNVVFSMTKINFLLVASYGLLYILVAVSEELLFRSFPLFVFAERYPLIIAISIGSILFGLAHLGNPNFSWLAMLNISLAGALFSIIILQQRNIGWAIGIHFAWNFTQGILLGYKVSGTDSPGMLSAKPIGSIYLSGGEFGIESSVFCTGLMIIVIVFLLVRYKIEPIISTIEDEEN